MPKRVVCLKRHAKRHRSIEPLEHLKILSLAACSSNPKAPHVDYFLASLMVAKPFSVCTFAK